MKLIIDLLDEVYNFTIQRGHLPYGVNIAGSIIDGEVLPKGHGRLIDADRLKTHFVGTEQGTDLEVYLESTIIDAPTIIEADKEEEE